MCMLQTGTEIIRGGAIGSVNWMDFRTLRNTQQQDCQTHTHTHTHTHTSKLMCMCTCVCANKKAPHIGMRSSLREPLVRSLAEPEEEEL